MGKKYAYSTNGESYSGDFDSVEAACDEAVADVPADTAFWVGECVPPPQPEDLWDVGDWIEHVSCQDEYSHDIAEGWGTTTLAQRDEVERDVRAALAAWLDRHGLRPTHFNIDNPQKFICRWPDGGKGYAEPADDQLKEAAHV